MPRVTLHLRSQARNRAESQAISAGNDVYAHIAWLLCEQSAEHCKDYNPYLSESIVGERPSILKNTSKLTDFIDDILGLDR